MNYQDILYEEKDRIAVITFNRPNKLNALSENMKREIDDALKKAVASENIAGIIFTGAGKAFVSGADLAEVNSLNGDERYNALEKMKNETQRLFDSIYYLEKPVIAAVNGYALGGGAELALACDIRVAGKNAKFGLPEVKLGLAAAFGGTQRLPRTIGIAMAKELCLTGRAVEADEAKEIGLVNRVVEQEELMSAAFALMESIVVNAPLAIKYNKLAINRGMEMTLNDALEYERFISGLLEHTEDAREGVAAFNEKRKPLFKNR